MLSVLLLLVERCGGGGVAWRDGEIIDGLVGWTYHMLGSDDLM